MIAATRGQSHTSESANHSASCSIAYASVCPRQLTRTYPGVPENAVAMLQHPSQEPIGMIPVPPRLGGAGPTNLNSQKVSDPRHGLAPPDSLLLRQRPPRSLSKTAVVSSINDCWYR